MKIKDIEQAHRIVVVAPRERGNDYAKIMPMVIKAIDTVENIAAGKQFVFLHNGVTSGSLSHVMEAVNKIQGPLQGRGRYASMRKIPLDIEMHGKEAEARWVKDALNLDPSLVFIIDNDDYAPARLARSIAKTKGIETIMVKIPKTQVKERLYV